MIKEAIQKIVRKGDLSYEEAYTVMNEIMDGKTTPTQNAAFLAALSTKSTRAETIDEISGCAEAMREHATPVPHPGMKVLEIVGTGGDGSNSFNISTTAAFVIAAAGVKVAKVLDKLGVRNALVVYGEDHLDEVSPSAPTLVCELKDGYYRTMTICPEDFGLTRGKKEELVGGTASENAEITKGILAGKLRGTKRNAVLMNAGLALYAAKAVPTMQEGVAKAAEMIDSGKAYEKLEEYVKVSNQ